MNYRKTGRMAGAVRMGAIVGMLASGLVLGGCVSVTDMSPKPQASAAPAPEAVPAQSEFVGIDPFEQVAQMGRGINVLSEDPGWADPANARFKPRYFKMLHEAGFSTVRIVMNAFEHMDQYYVLERGWVAYLDKMVNAALAEGLTVVLDEHDFNYCGEQPGPCAQKLNAFWAQIAPRYRDRSNRLVFEILNEPHEKFTPEMWNAQIKQTLPIIRATNPVRNVIIGPAFWYSLGYLDKLELPVADRHIIASFHYYAPMEFTHQGSPWVMQYKKTGRAWGSAEDLATLKADFDKVQAWSDKWNRPIFLGEFGAFETTPPDSRVKYDATIARTAEAHGWAWAYWQFDKDFILYDVSKEAFVEPILHALIPQK